LGRTRSAARCQQRGEREALGPEKARKVLGVARRGKKASAAEFEVTRARVAGCGVTKVVGRSAVAVQEGEGSAAGTVQEGERVQERGTRHESRRGDSLIAWIATLSWGDGCSLLRRNWQTQLG